MADYTITLSTEEEKALRWRILSIQDWLDNFVREAARRNADGICRLALEDQTHTILTLAEKRLLRDYLEQQGIVLASIEQFPDAVKKEIVKRARISLAGTSG